MLKVPVSVLVLLALSCLMVAGCSTLEEDPTKNWSAEQLYYSAKTDLDAKFYDRAIITYERLKIRYPFGAFTKQAKIDLAYTYWKKGDNVKTISACNDFIKDHPDHPSVDYVYYLKGLANFDDNPGLMKTLVYQSDLSQADVTRIRDAYSTLEQLVSRFPNSKYSEDAILRMKYLVNILARRELVTAEYYFRIGAFVAAINRAKFALSEYPDSIYTQNSLQLLSKSYAAMGMGEQKNKIDEIISVNFVDSGPIASGSGGISDWFKSFFGQSEDESEKSVPWWRFWKAQSNKTP